MCRIPLSRLLLTATALLSLPALRAADAYPRIDSGQETLRTLPACTVLMGDLPAGVDYFKADSSSFRPLLRYLDQNGLPQNTPVEGRPTGERALVFHLDAASSARVLPDAPGIRRVTLPERTVAALAARGGYDESHVTGLEKRLTAWVATRPDLVPAGPAYYVYWHAPYVPNFYRKVEVHLPVTRRATAAGAATPTSPPAAPASAGVPARSAAAP